MRTEERWNEKIQAKVMRRLFPARLVQDLERLQLEPVSTEGSHFIYSGNKSTGKTVLACRMLLMYEKQNYLQVQHTGTLFLPVTDFLNELKHSFDTPGESEIDILRKYQDIDVLVLDDLGTIKMSDWAYQTLYSLINYRYDNLKTTIITSNYSLKELSTAWQDDRITSRIGRMCQMLNKKHF